MGDRRPTRRAVARTTLIGLASGYTIGTVRAGTSGADRSAGVGSETTNIEYEESAFPDSVRIGEEFTAAISYTNPTSESIEVTGEYYVCVNTPEEARERGNSCYRVHEFDSSLGPEEGVSTTISPVIDADIPEEYRIPGERGQGISLSTDSDSVLGISVEEPLTLRPRYDPETATPTERDPVDTETPAVQSQTAERLFRLTGTETNITVDRTATITFSGVNLVGNDPMTVQLIVQTPSDVAVAGVANADSGSNQYTAVFRLEPGESRDVGVTLTANQPGEHTVTGIAAYYFGEDSTNTRQFVETVELSVDPTDTEKPARPATRRGTDRRTTSENGAGFTLAAAGAALGLGALSRSFSKTDDKGD